MGFALLFAEIYPTRRAKRNDLGQVLSKSKYGPVTVFFRRDLEQVALIIEKLRGHVPHRHYRIDQTGGCRALRIGSWRSCSAWAWVSLLHGGSDNRSWNCGVKGPTEGPLLHRPGRPPVGWLMGRRIDPVTRASHLHSNDFSEPESEVWNFTQDVWVHRKWKPICGRRPR